MGNRRSAMAGGDQRRVFSGLDALLLFLLLLQAHQLPAESASSHGRSSSSSASVFSLFNLRQKSRFWSESVIRGDFDDLESLSPGKKSALNYSQPGNIANYLKLQEVESVYLPIPNLSSNLKNSSAGSQTLIIFFGTHEFHLLVKS
ncbi:hypothetical protein AKJ16_DCAP08395 [Drosera capensis]